MSIGVVILIALMVAFLVYVVANAPPRYRWFGMGQIRQAQDNWAGIFGKTYPEDREGLDGDAARRPGRNEPCRCGSGRKFKHCHGRQPAG